MENQPFKTAFGGTNPRPRGAFRARAFAGEAPPFRLRAEELFLTFLSRFHGQDRQVGDKSGKAFAPALFAKEPEAKAAKVSKEALASAMGRLFSSNKLHMEPYGYPSRGMFRIAAGAKP